MADFNQPQHVLERIQMLASTQPDRIALIDESSEISYLQLHLEMINTQIFLENKYKVKKGDCVGILIENNIDCAVAFFSIIRIGAIAVIVNTKLAKPEIDFIIEDSKPVLIMVGNENLVSRVQGSVPVYIISPDGKEFDHSNEGEKSNPGYREEDCALIMYTSGTTGKPKGAKITHHNLIYAVDCYVKDVGITESDSTIVVVPLFYVTGLIAQLMVFLSLGAKVILLYRFDPDLALQKIHQYRVTHLHSVATVYLSLVNSIEKVKEFDLSCVRQALCGGGPITDALIDRLKKQLPWLEFRRIYGLTESTSPATVMPCDVQQMPEKNGSSGKPMCWTKAKVVDETLQEVGSGIAGELLLKGDNVIDHYWNNPEADARSFTDGWFRTGDIAEIDQDGFVYILDRKKDMIIRGGEKIFCSEVEGVLATYPGVKEVAVVGIPDHYYGEVVKAYIVPMDDMTLNVEDLLQFARTKLAKYKVPVAIDFLEMLPRSPVGKILKSALKTLK